MEIIATVKQIKSVVGDDCEDKQNKSNCQSKNCTGIWKTVCVQLMFCFCVYVSVCEPLDDVEIEFEFDLIYN